MSRDYLNKVAPSPNVFFDSSIPDVNLEYRSTLTGGRFVHSDHPFSINGYSPSSTGGAHSGKQKDHEGGSAGRAFTSENRVDPLQDVFDHALTVPMAFFSTLMTVKERMGNLDQQPNYEKWYHYGLSARSQDPAISSKIEAILSSYAKATDTVEYLDKAKAAAPKPKRTLGERLHRINSQLHSFRVSTAIDGENTVLSAANVCDAILGDAYGAVLDQRISPNKAWSQARSNSRSFQRQL